ncbi:ATP-binding protein [Actinosynnema sp. NPDC059797]
MTSPEPRDRHTARLTGPAADVVQAGEVHGGVHFHGSGESFTPPAQLPGDVPDFVNRTAEVARLDEAVAGGVGGAPAAGTYVVTGTAGVGKTSLVVHWAHRARRHYGDGQLYVNLRGYDPGPRVAPEEALDRFLRALGVPPKGIPRELEDRAALYRSRLSDRRVLVVLDNAATAGQVRPLLPGGASCLTLVTSRSRLSGLVARDGARRVRVDVLTPREAVVLLRSIMANYRPDDREEDLVELARLCARLPLALRIAAERASSRPLMPLRELIADLRDESALWDALTAEDDEEADAVRSVFAWSYRALPAPAAKLFRLLGLHPGPDFGIPAAAALIGAGHAVARHLLDLLVGTHVLEQHAPGRYRFHDLLRAYALDRTGREEAAEDRRAALERLLSWYLLTAARAAEAISPLNRGLALDPPVPGVHPAVFGDAGEALRWYEDERANLTAATRAARAAGLLAPAWRLPAVLVNIYARHNPFDDWIATTGIGLEAARALGDRRGEALLLDSLAMAHLQSHRLAEAHRRQRDALAVQEEIGDRSGAADSTTALGLIAWRGHRLAEARAHFERALAIHRELREPRGVATALANIAMVDHDLGRDERAVVGLREALAVYRELGDRFYEGNALHFLACALRELGELDEARVAVEAALDVAVAEGSAAVEGFWLLELARVRRAAGRPDEALTACQRAAVIQRRLGDRSREALALDGAGEVYQELDMPEEGAKFHRRAAAVHRELGDRWHLALSLANLARCVERPVPVRREALAALEGFDDPKAIALRDELAAALGPPGAVE